MAKRSKKDFDIHHPDMVRMIFILTSVAIVAFLVLVVKYTSFKSEPKAAENYQIKRDNKICTSTFSNRKHTECMWSTFGVPCGTKYTLKGKVKTVRSNVACGQVIPGKLEEWKYKWLNLPQPGIKTLYCCVSEN